MLALLLGACGGPADAPGPPAYHQVRGEAFGTTWSVKWQGPDPSEEEAAARIAEVLQQVDARMSSWREDSEINAVRAGAGPVEVSPETAEVVAASLGLAEATAGAFDPTVEPLMVLWGYRGERREEPPSEAEIARALARIGWDRVRVDLEGATVDAGGTALDLSAIAKGHAVDRVSLALSALGASSHLVEIGGEVRAHGEGPEGDWRLGVDRPEENVAPGSTLAAVVTLRNAGLATSGNYRSAYDAGGTRIVHTMDPRVGRPHESEIASVTVVAPDCRTADGWATALMVLPPEVGRRAVDARPELEALWLLATDEGFREVRSPGMGAWLAAP